MRKKKFLAAMLALAMSFTSIQLPPMQVNAEETTISDIKDHWTFDTLTSDTENGATGTLNGNVNIADSGSTVFGKVLRFGTGVNNFMKLENYINTGTNSTSFSMWYRYDTTISESKPQASAVLLQHEDGSTGNGRTILDLTSAGKYHTYLNAGNVLSNGTVTKGDWQHITVTFDQDTKKVCYYINGVLDGEKDLTSNAVTNEALNLRLGAHKSTNADDPHPMRGDVDEFYVFEKVLTAEEAKAIYDEKANELAHYEECKASLAALITEADALCSDKEAEVVKGGVLDQAHVDAFTAVETAVNAGRNVAANAPVEELETAISAIETAMEVLRNIYLDEVKLHGSSLTLNGTIDVNFYMVLEDADALKTAGAYMNFTLDGKDYSKVYVSDVETKVQDEVNCHVFKCGIPVKDMGGEIKAQMVVPDSEGNVVRKGLVYTQSVKGYIDYILGDTVTYAKELELVEAMSDFGDFATVYFKDGSVSDEVLAKIENVDIEDLSEYAPKEGAIPEKDIYVGSSLLLKSDTLLRHYFKTLF